MRLSLYIQFCSAYFKNEIIKFNESQNESQKTIKALRIKAKTTAKETCSCYNMPIDDDLLNLLPKSK